MGANVEVALSVRVARTAVSRRKGDICGAFAVWNPHRIGSTNECYRYKFIKGSAIGASIFSDVGYFRTLGGLTNDRSMLTGCF